MHGWIETFSIHIKASLTALIAIHLFGFNFMIDCLMFVSSKKKKLNYICLKCSCFLCVRLSTTSPGVFCLIRDCIYFTLSLLQIKTWRQVKESYNTWH